MEQDTDRTDQVHRVIELLIHNSRVHHRLIEKVCGNSGVHRSQRKVLMFLSESKQAHSQREIAERFDVSPACITRLLKGLIAEGYVECSNDVKDLRRNSVRISEKGLKMMNDTYRSFDQFDQSIFYDFSSEELNTFSGLLSHMQDNLRIREQTEEQEGSALH